MEESKPETSAIKADSGFMNPERANELVRTVDPLAGIASLYQPKEEEIADVSVLLMYGMKRKDIREAARGFKAKGTKIKFVNRPGDTIRENGVIYFITNKGKLMPIGAYAEKRKDISNSPAGKADNSDKIGSQGKESGSGEGIPNSVGGPETPNIG